MKTFYRIRKSGYQMGIFETESDELQYQPTLCCCGFDSGTCVNGGRDLVVLAIGNRRNEPVQGGTSGMRDRPFKTVDYLYCRMCTGSVGAVRIFSGRFFGQRLAGGVLKLQRFAAEVQELDTQLAEGDTAAALAGWREGKCQRHGWALQSARSNSPKRRGQKPSEDPVAFLFDQKFSALYAL